LQLAIGEWLRSLLGETGNAVAFGKVVLGIAYVAIDERLPMGLSPKCVPFYGAAGVPGVGAHRLAYSLISCRVIRSGLRAQKSSVAGVAVPVPEGGATSPVLA
jgi:hypothetical protein